MSKKYSAYILSGALFILGLSVGFFAGKQLNSPKVMPVAPGTRQEANSLFSSQTAAFRGEITKVDGKNLSVKSLNSNATGNITVSDRVIIIKAGKTGTSADLSSLELNKEVLISLEMKNGNYDAISIQYPAPLPSLPSIGSKL